MPGLFDKFKHVSADLVKKSTSAATELWDKYGDLITSRLLEVANEVAKYGKQQIADDEKYKRHVVDRLWDMLPLPVRLLGRKRLRWDALLFEIRHTIFLIEGDDVTVHPDAKEKIAAAFKSVLVGHRTLSDTSLEDSESTGEPKAP